MKDHLCVCCRKPREWASDDLCFACKKAAESHEDNLKNEYQETGQCYFCKVNGTTTGGLCDQCLDSLESPHQASLEGEEYQVGKNPTGLEILAGLVVGLVGAFLVVIMILVGLFVGGAVLLVGVACFLIDAIMENLFEILVVTVVALLVWTLLNY